MKALSSAVIVLIAGLGLYLLFLAPDTSSPGPAPAPEKRTSSREVSVPIAQGDVISDEKNSPDESSPVSQSERKELPPPRIQVRDFEPDDRKMFNGIVGLLEYENLPPIDVDSDIAVEDLETVRAIYRESRRAMDQASEDWHKAGKALMSVREKEVLRDIAAGNGARHEEGPNNSVRGDHPYDMVTQLMSGGKRYVIKVSVEEEPRLLQAGEALEQATRARVSDFDSLIRRLFTPIDKEAR